MSKFPLSPRKALKILRNLRKEAEKQVKILVVGKERSVATLLSLFLSPSDDADIFPTFVMGDDKVTKKVAEEILTSNLVLVVASPDEIFKETYLFLITLIKKAAKPYLIVLEKDFSAEANEKTKKELEKVVGVSSYHVVLDKVSKIKLAKAILNELSEFKIALARRVAVFRELVAAEVITKTKFQNALIGAIPVPYADMPLLTLNQAKMVLEIAAIYGSELKFSRLRELLMVVGGGFTFRALARELLSFVPGYGWLIKGAVAYGGTAAVGRTAIKYFENRLDRLKLKDLKEVLEEMQKI